MARELADVADYFLPRISAGPPRGPLAAPPLPSRDVEPLRASRPAALPIVAVPVGDRDVVRAAFVWNLAVEVARLREIVDDGESPATPAIVVGAVLAFVVPFAAMLIFLAFVVAHFASR